MSNTLNLLKKHHIRPNKHYGQSFLIDDDMFRKIVVAGQVKPGDTVVEIGAGLGVMTGLIADVAAQVFAVEVDPNLIDVLRENLRGKDNIEIVHQDILHVDFNAVTSGIPKGKIKVMGNIPYNITSEILFHLLEYRSVIHSAVLLMQQEVAERLTADPGTKTYGIPSVILSMYADLETLFSVSNRCFYPVPAVQSAVIRMTFRAEPRYTLRNEAFFSRLVRASFAQRRKTLLNNLKAFRKIEKTPEEIVALLAGLHIDGTRRAETLKLSEFASLANALGDNTQ
ncbi:MAG: 16S rRNA (adenine(1518)-N(6)/adenine(1519)-N(6))-dimethyltransferase RsmA [Syntrophales bacterium]|nr:16S rRNA (adenine(1518)-N(6)/adenine(1519)-N(6))-dimethyltransferase RsmA [Syntrophales bacterium]